MNANRFMRGFAGGAVGTLVGGGALLGRGPREGGLIEHEVDRRAKLRGDFLRRGRVGFSGTVGAGQDEGPCHILQNIGDDDRRWLEIHACRQAVELAAGFRLIPRIIDRDAIEAARVEARLRCAAV